ncbi:MAG: lysozyme inhibitor LprI family protein [Chthoniobacterales bacterium]
MNPTTPPRSVTQSIGVLSIFCVLSIFSLTAQRVSAEEEAPAPTLQEAKADFKTQDKALNAAWELVKKSENLTASELAALKEEQKAWIEYRDYLSLSPSYSGVPENETEAKESAEYFDCAAAITAERTAWLKGHLLATAPENVTGVWSDSYGGTLQIVQKDGEIFFTIDVVRGPTAHNGSISGIASWNEPLGWFSDKEGEEDKTDEANVSFVLKRNVFQITTANASSYAGARAYFDGDYLFVKPLDAEAQAQVIADAQNLGEEQ